MQLLKALSKVTFAGILSSWGVVSLILISKNKQIEAEIWMAHVLYVFESLASLINLQKLNKSGFH